MMVIQTTIEIRADALAPGGTIVFLLPTETDGNVKRWKTSAFKPAAASKVIFDQKTGSFPIVVALVMKSNRPEGTISSKPLFDQDSKCCANPRIGTCLEKPSIRRSNMMAGPTKRTIPVMCTISRPGYNHVDWRMATAKEVFSNHCSILGRSGSMPLCDC
jgi:hypothetical protein